MGYYKLLLSLPHAGKHQRIIVSHKASQKNKKTAK
jgi:hypothetical protein